MSEPSQDETVDSQPPDAPTVKPNLEAETVLHQVQELKTTSILYPGGVPRPHTSHKRGVSFGDDVVCPSAELAPAEARLSSSSNECK